MAGLFNNGIRDYCGDQNSMTKLSNHLSKDCAFRQEIINNNDNNVTNSLNIIPKSFNYNDLLKEATSHQPKTTQSSTVDKVNENLSNECLKSNSKDIWTFSPIYTPPDNFYQASNFGISHNIPMNRFIPPEPSLLAEQWAENELSKFDNKIINENDLESLSDDVSTIRFIDVLQNMVVDEDNVDIDLFKDGNDEVINKSIYNLDRDLKNMRDKVDPFADATDVWLKIEKSLQENSADMVFNKSNHFMNNLNEIENVIDEKAIDEILHKGLRLYREGYFSEATLAFEAVVQMRPKCEEGWSYLGMSLSENEQDHRAIVACNKCLSLNKNNREVLLSLARIHCNEMNLSSTIACLEQWLLANPKYCDLATVGQQAIHLSSEDNSYLWDDMYDVAFESSGKFTIIDEQLTLALERNGVDIDPELEIAAGTLYHSVQDYERATMRFEAAVNVVKDNAGLWSKLGTAYCNSGNYQNAVNAYHKAIDLAPGFARAQCNLGVAYYNMECFREAICHAIKAYKIQHSKNNGNIKHNYDRVIESDPIWTLIRMSNYKLDRPDLDTIIFNRDVEALSKEFDV